MPVCRTYEAAKEQHEKVHKRRVELIEVNTPLVSQFQQEEETRKAKLKTKEGQEADDKERDEVDEEEVQSVFRNCFELVREMFRVVLRFPQMKARDMKEPRKKLTKDQKKERLADMRRYMSGARAVTETMTMQEIKEAEARVEAFMATQFTEYVPLNHHLFNFQA